MNGQVLQFGLSIIALFISIISITMSYWQWAKGRELLTISISRDIEAEVLLQSSAPIIAVKVDNISLEYPTKIREAWPHSVSGQRLDLIDPNNPFMEYEEDPESYRINQAGSKISKLNPGGAPYVRYLSCKVIAECCIYKKVDPKNVRIWVVDHTKHVHKEKLGRELISLIKKEEELLILKSDQ